MDLQNQFATMFGLTGGVNSTLHQFGITFSPGLLKVQAYQLPRPQIQYGGNKRADPKDDTSWNMDRLLKAARLPRCLVLEIKSSDTPSNLERIRDTVARIFDSCRRLGMITAGRVDSNDYLTAELPTHGDSDVQSIIERFNDIRDNVGESDNPPIVLCFLPSANPKIYNAVKRGGDIIAGVLTVCLSCDKVIYKRAADAYFTNLALKLNLKSGGVNHSTQGELKLRNIFRAYERNEVMLMGADVSHSGSRVLPSITAVVATYEASQSRPYASIDIQKNGEMIQKLKEGFLERLRLFKKKNSKLPASIVMFRDGVSESQYKEVMNEEITKMEEALQECVRSEPRGTAKPKLTVVVVGKRHQTRFFPVNPGIRDNINTPAGLVVDRGVTAIYERDFFLQAHHAIMGTARPAHYFVLQDENGFTESQIQELTNIWSYTFGRSMRSVSYAPTAYCADLACGRARAWIQPGIDAIRAARPTAPPASDKAAVDELASANLRTIQDGATIQLHPRLRETMWYI
ncbi:hypothetical protein DRE_00906 [Drechslerella stenobrocha 248]|uniref:Piwi domain-containing protein n=1 Tax=Drechslerella stenobrocha 248 TaxID=1043628 RepID=W7HXK0_9PEZI|nr:hypothetical protein DRE_00906 [Drechslerella stenobrocha 248]